MCHVKEPVSMIDKIMGVKDTLKTPYTWETVLSENDGRSKTEKWTELIKSDKLPYMATLRNLRNILEHVKDPFTLVKVADKIADPENVKRSKQLPFRFLSAYLSLTQRKANRGMRYYGYNEVSTPKNPYVPKFLTAIEKAVRVSFQNIPRLPGTTLIATDVSGSMQHTISAKSEVQLYDIGLLLMAGVKEFCDGRYTGIFGNTFAQYEVPDGDNIIQTVLDLAEIEGRVGYATNGYEVVDYAYTHDLHVDRFMIFTDGELWDSYGNRTLKQSFDRYKKAHNTRCKLYMFNLKGHGTVQFPEGRRDVVNINGWSENVFKFMEATEKNPEAQMKYVESYISPRQEIKKQEEA